jgi:hypothetical protein
MAAVIKDMERMKDKWELLMPRVFLPASVRASGTPATVKIRHGDMVLVTPSYFVGTCRTPVGGLP